MIMTYLCAIKRSFDEVAYTSQQYVVLEIETKICDIQKTERDKLRRHITILQMFHKFKSGISQKSIKKIMGNVIPI